MDEGLQTDWQAVVEGLGHPIGDAWLDAVRHNDASDIHVTVDEPAVARIDGALHTLDGGTLDAETIRAVLRHLMPPRAFERLEAGEEADFGFALTDGMRFRAHAYLASGGPALALRPIKTEAPRLEHIGAPPVLYRIARRQRGLVLVTGPTGSGKSTTLAALIEEINRNRACHIVTIEDPVEFVFTSRQALISQRQVGRDTHSFQAALRAALRSDPDVLLVGEMRDLETISLALTAAETGHLVLGTLHTAGAAKTVDRIIDVFPPGAKDMVRAQLATSLRAVISQVLFPKVGGGRVAAFEVLLATPAIRNMIREMQVHQIDSMLQLGAKIGMTRMREEVQRLVSDGLVGHDDAEAVIGELYDPATDKGGKTGPGDWFDIGDWSDPPPQRKSVSGASPDAARGYEF